VKVEVEEEEEGSQSAATGSKQASKHVLGLAVGGSGTTFTHPSQPEKKRGPRPASTEKDRQKRSLRHTYRPSQGSSGDGDFAAWPG